MNTKSALGAALLAIAISYLPATASERQAAEPGLFAPHFDETLPPVGFVNFCAAHVDECDAYSVSERLSSARITMTPQRWNALYQINTYVNAKVVPVSDTELYGEAERWTYPDKAGDCEDYVLLKKRLLEKLGIAPKSLQITVVIDERGEGHAVLTATTEEGDYILDNRRNEILLWNDTKYTFLKRQSSDSPRKWVALLPKPRGNAAVTSAEKP